MNLADWHQVLATEPATPNQVGALHREFARLGIDDRPERLAISAALLGLDELGSTTHLVMGQAGQLVGILRQARDRADLPAVTVAAAEAAPHDEHQDHDDAGAEERVRLIDVIRAVLVTVLNAHYRRETGNEETSHKRASSADLLGRLSRAQGGVKPVDQTFGAT